jgi:inhibitor of cysteine peptidase
MWSARAKEWTGPLRWLGFLVMTILLVIGTAGNSYADNADRKVTLNKPFEIKLEANPTTGYQWEASYDKELLRLDDKNHERDPSKPDTLVGVGGVTTFVFTPIKAGKTTIDFHYKRSWEKEVAKKRSYRVTIVP